MNSLLYAVADKLMFADAVLLQHGDAPSSNAHHHITNHLKMAPHRLGRDGRGCHLADLQVSVDGAEANDNGIADNRDDDDCIDDVDDDDDDDGAVDDDDDDDCEIEPDTDD